MVQALLLQLYLWCQSYWWLHSKKKYICSENYRNFCLNCPSQVKLWIHRGEGWFKSPSVIKMTFQEISEAVPRPVLWKVFRKYFINLINFSKFLAMLYHKQTYKGSYLCNCTSFPCNFAWKMNSPICIFPKEQIIYRTGLGNYFPNRGCLLWNHV